MYLVAQSCPTLCDPVDCSLPEFLPEFSPWNSPDKNIEVGSYSLLQGIFLIQGSNPGLLHCRWIIYCLNHQGSPSILLVPGIVSDRRSQEISTIFSKLKMKFGKPKMKAKVSVVWKVIQRVWESLGHDESHFGFSKSPGCPFEDQESKHLGVGKNLKSH